MLNRFLAFALVLLLTVFAVAQNKDQEKSSQPAQRVDQAMVSRQQQTPSAANGTSLADTLKRLQHQSGSPDGVGRGMVTFGVGFSACKLSFREEENPAGRQPNSSSSRLNGLIVPPTFTFTVKLADLDFGQVVSDLLSDRATIKFNTANNAKSIREEVSAPLPFPDYSRSRSQNDADRWRDHGSIDIRDRRLAPQFVEAFAYAITLCRLQP